ncbi:hypothetical protein [Streptomyces sp. B6B3]|uniref:hypothetical protein n=1 Tax=Streptomyces sp. B6B3 TaxID=3153570 RepID=UPI00325DDBCE
MRTTLKLALPAVAAAALLLAGCGDDGDDDGGTGSGGEQEQQEQDESTGDSAASGDLEGNWATGLDGSDSVLTFIGTNVTFTESIAGGLDSAICFGTVADDAMTLECDTSDAADWTEATLARDGETLTVEWGSGTSQTYEPISEDQLSDL